MSRPGVFMLGLLLAACDGTNEPVEAVEICDNLRDDDGDTLIDCADADCVGSCPENCVDALDNDGDGDVDCADADCDGLCPEDCTDDRDNDGDLLIDCNDTDCLGFCPEDCNDGVDNDGDGLFDCVDPDCADPSCPELCTDSADNDGDGLVDCDDPSCDGSCTERCSDLRDNDGDGFTDCEDVDCDGECPEHCTDGRDNDGDGALDCADPDCDGQCDQDGDGYLDAAGGGLDCDDTNAGIHPFAREICNAADDDCDGLEDEADPSLDPATLFTFYPDLDGDGYGDDSAASGEGCVPPSGAVTIGGDCADGNPARNPAALEVCDLVDNDCDELTDDADPDIDPLLQQTWYADVDGDGFGDAADTVQSCLPPSGYVGNGLDCHVFDPRYALVQDWWRDGDGDGYGAGSPQIACIGPSGFVDNDADCDDSDPALSPDTPRHRDADLDGYGSPVDVVHSCAPVPGYVDDDQDCNDSSFAVHPLTVWALDEDGDGYGHPVATVTGCDPVEGHTFDTTDCDDTEFFTNPGAFELCDGEDNDCDIEIDEDAVDQTWYLDLDGDGAGRSNVSVTQCTAPPAPASLIGGDCDDSDPLLNLWDTDGDGVDTCGGDCNDNHPLIRPGAPDACEDGVDQDCDGVDPACVTRGLWTVRQTDGMVQVIDPMSLSVTDIGPLGVGFSYGDLAWSPATNTMYMVDGRSGDNLYTIDTDTGAATLVGNHGEDLFALVWDRPTGRLLGGEYNTSYVLFDMNLANGNASSIGSSTYQYDGLAWDSTRNRVVGINNREQFFEVNTSSGSSTLLYDGPNGISNCDIAYDAGTDRYWMINYPGDLYSYDPVTFSRTLELSGLGRHDALTSVR